MEKVLIAGASGYLGGFIAAALKKQGYFVRAITRDKSKLKKQKPEPDEIFQAEITRPETLVNCCQGIDMVITTVGITRQKDGLTYMDVDYQGNLNLLREAQKSKVKKFLFIFIAHAAQMQHLKIIEAKQLFVDQLKASGLDYCLIEPTGFFSDMAEFLKMAQRGKIYLLGTGNLKINPIDGQDLAAVCVNALKNNEKEIAAGGPEILSYREIAEMAFKALGKNPKIFYIPFPTWLKDVVFFLLHTFTPVRIYGPIEFFLTVISMDMVAPQHGTRKLADYFRECLKQPV